MHKHLFSPYDASPKPSVAGWSFMTMLAAAAVARFIFLPSSSSEVRNNKKVKELELKLNSILKQVPELAGMRARWLSGPRAPWYRRPLSTSTPSIFPVTDADYLSTMSISPSADRSINDMIDDLGAAVETADVLAVETAAVETADSLTAQPADDFVAVETADDFVAVETADDALTVETAAVETAGGAAVETANKFDAGIDADKFDAFKFDADGHANKFGAVQFNEGNFAYVTVDGAVETTIAPGLGTEVYMTDYMMDVVSFLIFLFYLLNCKLSFLKATSSGEPSGRVREIVEQPVVAIRNGDAAA